MHLTAAETRFDATPAAALEAIASYNGPVFVDLDETLYLRNSTEDFIDSACPGLLAVLLLRALDLLRPWRMTGGDITRDAWRVGLVAWLFPWVRVRWRRRTPELAARHLNRPLMAALQASPIRPTILTVGFMPIVTPLIAALGLKGATVVAARGFGAKDRRSGKLQMVTEALGTDTVRRALVITDSAQDGPLLAQCARPLRTIWPSARYCPALERVYLPGRYLTRIKRPGERYIFRGILQDDFAYWVLSSISLAAVPVLHVAGLLLLLLSFWCIYERGYVDNDKIAEQYEQDPKLSSEYGAMSVPTPRWQPWIWAIVSGAAAVLLLRGPDHAKPADFAKWLAVLLAVHYWFRLYNRCDKSTRVWMFAFLQLARSAAHVVLVPVVAVGAAALGAQVLARWVPYYVYRFGKVDWPKAHTHLTRALFFVVLCILLIVSQGPAAVLNWTAAAILAWSLFRARHELAAVFRGAHRLDRLTPPP